MLHARKSVWVSVLPLKTNRSLSPNDSPITLIIEKYSLSVMRIKIQAIVITVIIVSVAGATGVTAQEVETEIQFEDEVVVDEETTVTYVANVVETPVETNVEVELTLLVDGEEVRTQTTEEEVFDGAELRTEFAHTFDSSGEKEVTVDSVTEVFGQRITDSTTETVTVMAEDDGDGTEDGVGNGTGEGSAGNSTGGSADDGDMEEGTGDGIGDDTAGGVSNQTESTTDEMEDGGDGINDNGTDDETDVEGGDTGEGLPGFGAVAALVSLAAVAVYAKRRRG